MVGRCRKCRQKSRHGLAIRAVFLAFSAFFVVACGASGAGNRGTTPATAVEMEEMRITARRGPRGYEFEAYDADQLFARATELLNAKQCREAVELYDRLEREFATSRYASAALYNAGLCLQALADFAAAADRFTALRERHPASDDIQDASFQLAEVLVQLERWDPTLAVSDELLAREKLSSDERLEAMTRRGQALLGLARFDDAEAYARGALAYFRTRQGDDVIRDEFFAAGSNFVLAESFRLRAQSLAFPADPEGQKDVLLRRAQLLLQAQQEYFNTIQFQNLDNLHWAAASGYRIGNMYDEMWHSIMNAPVPASLPKEVQAVYREELAKFVKPLIRHAIRYWEMTLMMIERTGVRTDWAAKANADLDRVRALMADQPPGPGGLDHVKQRQEAAAQSGGSGVATPTPVTSAPASSPAGKPVAPASKLRAAHPAGGPPPSADQTPKAAAVPPKTESSK